MPLHQEREGRPLLPGQEALQELAVRLLVAGMLEHRFLQVMKKAFHGSLKGTGPGRVGASIFLERNLIISPSFFTTKITKTTKRKAGKKHSFPSPFVVLAVFVLHNPS
jgi:hypothetical protein